ncbi:MAG: hypothetical protein K0U37_03910 [Gammaproteobacteria bacterium]|nr:hypothetical protein [Gammaproteobacteria bacterium]
MINILLHEKRRAKDLLTGTIAQIQSVTEDTTVTTDEMLEMWWTAFSSAKELDALNYLLWKERMSSYLGLFTILYSLVIMGIGLSVFIELDSFFSQNMSESEFFYVALIFSVSITFLSFLPIICPFSSCMSKYGFFSTNERAIKNNFYELCEFDSRFQNPRSSALHPSMFSTKTDTLFEQNRVIHIGYSSNLSEEIRRLSKRLFWARLNPCHNHNKLYDVHRFLMALQYFHTGRPAISLQLLAKPFSSSSIQQAANKIIAINIFLLEKYLVHFTKKELQQLIAYYSREQPDSLEFISSSYQLQHPNTRDMPADWEPDLSDSPDCDSQWWDQYQLLEMIANTYEQAVLCSKSVPPSETIEAHDDELSRPLLV